MLTTKLAAKPFHVTRPDGTTLRGWRAGRGPLRWLLTPGLGTPISCWRPYFDCLGERVTFLAWDMRGCYGSTLPGDRERVGIGHHAEDGLALARAEGWQDGSYVVGGWSLGVQIALEIRRLVGSVQGLVLINGPYEHVLRSAMPLPGAERLLAALLPWAHTLRPVLNPLLGKALALRQTPDLLRGSGLLAQTGPLVRDVLAEFQGVDFAALAALALAAHRHSARDVLPHIDEPTLVVAGGRDTLTPPALGQSLHRAVKSSEFLLLPRGTHYTPIEFPDVVIERVATFLRTRVQLAATA